MFAFGAVRFSDKIAEERAKYGEWFRVVANPAGKLVATSMIKSTKQSLPQDH